MTKLLAKHQKHGNHLINNDMSIWQAPSPSTCMVPPSRTIACANLGILSISTIWKLMAIIGKIKYRKRLTKETSLFLSRIHCLLSWQRFCQDSNHHSNHHRLLQDSSRIRTCWTIMPWRWLRVDLWSHKILALEIVEYFCALLVQTRSCIAFINKYRTVCKLLLTHWHGLITTQWGCTE